MPLANTITVDRLCLLLIEGALLGMDHLYMKRFQILERLSLVCDKSDKSANSYVCHTLNYRVSPVAQRRNWEYLW